MIAAVYRREASGLCLNVNNVTNAFSDQRVSDWGLVGDLILKAVCLCGTNELEFHLLVEIDIVNLYDTSDVDLVKVYLVLNNDLRVL